MTTVITYEKETKNYIVRSSLGSAEVGRWCKIECNEIPDRCSCLDYEKFLHNTATGYYELAGYRYGTCENCAKSHIFKYENISDYEYFKEKLPSYRANKECVLCNGKGKRRLISVHDHPLNYKATNIYHFCTCVMKNDLYYYARGRKKEIERLVKRAMRIDKELKNPEVMQFTELAEEYRWLIKYYWTNYPKVHTEN